MGILREIRNKLDRVDDLISEFNSDKGMVRWMTNRHEQEAKRQQEVIQWLLDALCEKYGTGYFCLGDDNANDKPFVVHNGEELTKGHVTEVTIHWMEGEAPTIDILHEGTK